MIQGRQLRFVEPTPSGFRAVLQPELAGEPVVLMGEGPLADGLRGIAEDEGLVLYPGTEPPMCPDHPRILFLAEVDEERLSALLLGCVDLENVLIVAPITNRHFSRNPLFIVSIPKSGTHLVYELAGALGYGRGVTCSDPPRPQTWYCVEYDNSHTVARDFFVDTTRRSIFGNRHHPFPHVPVLFCYRHPFDILVSEAHYYARDGKTIFASYFADDSFEDRLRRLADDEWLLGSLRQRVGAFLPWLRFPNVIPASFEELVGAEGGSSCDAQYRLIWSIQLKLHVDGSVAEIARRVFNRNAATFREGRVGAYRAQLSRDLIDRLERTCGDVLSGFGYSVLTESIIPANASDYVTRPLRLSSVSFDNMPICVEPAFLGCNLVRYAGKFFAVPISAGGLKLDELPTDRLDRLPSAASLVELKALLLLGWESLDRLSSKIFALGQSMCRDGTAEPSGSYWHDRGEPEIIEEYKGFNLIRRGRRYIALRQATGPVDLTEDWEILSDRYSPRDVFIASNVDGLKIRIECMYRYAALSEQPKAEDIWGRRIDAMQRELGLAVDDIERLRTGMDEFCLKSELFEHLKAEDIWGRRIDAMQRELSLAVGGIERLRVEMDEICRKSDRGFFARAKRALCLLFNREAR